MKKLIVFFIVFSLFVFSGFAMGSGEGDLNLLGEREKTLVLGAARDFKGNIEAGTLVFDTLATLDSERKAQPAALERWTVNKESTEFVLYLRKGLTYSDGTAVTAEDLKKSIEVLGKAQFRSYSPKLKRIDIMDKTSVKVVMKTPFLFLFDELEKVQLIPAKFLQENGTITEYIGSGPYILKDYEKNVRAVLVKNPNYWEKKPYTIENLVWLVIPDANARKLALQAGQVDVIGITEHYAGTIPLAVSHELSGSKEFTKLLQDPKSYTIVFSMGLNYKKDSLKDKALRHALQYVINREAFTKELFFGQANACGYLFNPSFDDGPKNKKPFVYDLKKAKEILTKAGYTWNNGALTKDGKKITLTYVSTTTPQQKDIAVFAQNALKEIGIEVNIEAVNSPVAIEKIKKGEWDMSFSLSLFEPLTTSLEFGGLNSDYNEFGIGFGINSETVKAAEKILEAKDLQTFKKAVAEYWDVQWEEYPFIPLYTQTRRAFYKKDLSGFNFSKSTYKIDLSNVKWGK
ncbi:MULTISPECIES: ABC transporter substrate-binding protein [unclassified Treponema]|uniref:ABC transporter substrate-binding protein n=1 Tax=unclassified Treponema TaxID=2638727 RepID=UPI0020A3172F|nr:MULTISPECIES: ABC transporter substrate-binding protein [unclassified Treponema]UTC65933.1 ABC transporter substrate-binding protein [Treponema sp. OMZ 789]UTC68661.1 ABC transporter substrate-binding protein [Treponema sp. OMZ 790]UTC71391.1 ABC transporter substrate-binding protein [Treponema sp. OMZ 791]